MAPDAFTSGLMMSLGTRLLLGWGVHFPGETSETRFCSLQLLVLGELDYAEQSCQRFEGGGEFAIGKQWKHLGCA